MYPGHTSAWKLASAKASVRPPYWSLGFPSSPTRAHVRRVMGEAWGLAGGAEQLADGGGCCGMTGVGVAGVGSGRAASAGWAIALVRVAMESAGCCGACPVARRTEDGPAVAPPDAERARRHPQPLPGAAMELSAAAAGCSGRDPEPNARAPPRGTCACADGPNTRWRCAAMPTGDLCG